jgi:protein-disulfide isomerase
MIVRRHALIGAALMALAAGPAFAAPAAEPGDMSLGNPNARVKVVEYASLSCPHCAHFNDDVFPAFKAKYVDTGRVYYTLKEVLTAPQQVAAAGFILARCAGPAKYFDVVDGVFKSQLSWKPDNIREVLFGVAKANGVDEAKAEACLKDQAATTALNGRMARIANDGVEGTPSFFINGKKFMEGVPTFEQLDAAVAAAAK